MLTMIMLTMRITSCYSSLEHKRLSNPRAGGASRNRPRSTARTSEGLDGRRAEPPDEASVPGICAAEPCRLPPEAPTRGRVGWGASEAAARPQDSDRYKVANCTQTQPAFYGFLRLARGKVISVTVLTVALGVSLARNSYGDDFRARSLRRRKNRPQYEVDTDVHDHYMQ